MAENPSAPALKRSLGPVLVTFYGLGTIIGAGIYVLVGEVAAISGTSMIFAFLLAGLVAVLTALSYAELASRYPRCAGAALYVQRAWHQPRLSSLAGWLLMLTGIVSSATICRGFVGYLHEFLPVNDVWAIVLTNLVLGIIAIVGIGFSTRIVALITLIEVGGLCMVTYIGFSAPLPATAISLTSSIDFSLVPVLLGAQLAFFAFIGFEDMVNLVEEIKRPERNLPLSICLAVGLSLLLYCLVALAAQRAIPLETLASSSAPLAEVVRDYGHPKLIAAISLVAVINGALVQIIMASRLLYGMAQENLAPAFFGRIHSRTSTPIRSTLLIVLLITGFALALPLNQLARLTSLIILVIFLAVHLALWRIKGHPDTPTPRLHLPRWLPLVGAFLCFLLLAGQISFFTD